MGEDSFPQQFERLEAKIEQLVRTCNDLREVKAGLEKRVGELEDMLRAKDATEQSYREEKSMIRSRVDSLLGRIDKVLEST